MLPGYLRRLVRCVPYARRNNMDYHSPRAALLIGATLSFVLVARSQPACFFSEPFNGPALPTGWIASPDSVAQQSSIGDPLGTNTIAWRIGTAESASSNGYFPVPDLPLGNTFAMVNDDAPPCNCDMDMVTLTSPPIALAFHLNTMVEFRAYNDGRPQHGEAWLDASSDGLSWSPLERIPEVLALWQTVRADLGAYDGGQVYLRFRWSDAHAWASGFAIDDVCVFDRVANDLSLLAAYISDPTLNVLDETGRSLESAASTGTTAAPRACRACAEPRHRHSRERVGACGHQLERRCTGRAVPIARSGIAPRSGYVGDPEHGMDRERGRVGERRVQRVCERNG